MMGKENKKTSTSNHKKDDGKFRSKKIKHSPEAESARAVYGLDETKEADRSGTGR